MARLHHHQETHLIDRIGWLRAAVLGANDGILSTASLIVGVAAASTSTGEVLLAGTAGLGPVDHDGIAMIYGCGRICICQLSIGHRNGRSRA